MRIPAAYLVHEVTVEPLTGTGAYGPVYGAQFPLACFAAGATRMVRTRDGDTAGSEVLSTLTVLAAPGTADQVPPGSRVRWRDAWHTVLQSTEHDDQGLGAPQHTELACE